MDIQELLSILTSEEPKVVEKGLVRFLKLIRDTHEIKVDRGLESWQENAREGGDHQSQEDQSVDISNRPLEEDYLETDDDADAASEDADSEGDGEEEEQELEEDKLEPPSSTPPRGRSERVDAEEGPKGLLQEYIRQSPLLTELFELWDSDLRAKSVNLMTTHTEIFAVILRVCRGKAAFPWCKRILKERLTGLYKQLVQGAETSSSLAQATLRLLTALALQSRLIARDVQRKYLEFAANKPLQRLPFRRPSKSNPKATVDVRANFVELICTLLETKVPEIQRELLEPQGLFDSVLKGLEEDEFRVISRIVATLQGSVLENKQLLYKFKSEFFNSYVLEALARLSAGSDEPNIANLVDNLLDQVCCHSEHSVFRPATGAGSSLWAQNKYQDKVLLRVIMTLRPQEILSHRRLAVAVIQRFPGLLFLYLKSFPYSLEPKVSSRWLANVSWFETLLRTELTIESQTAVLRTSNPSAGDGQGHPQTIDKATLVNFIIPSKVNKKELGKGLQQKNWYIVYVTVNLVINLLRRARCYCELLSQIRLQEDVRQFLKQRLPEVQILVALQNRLVQELSIANEEPNEEGERYRQIQLLYQRLLVCLRLYFEEIPSSVTEARLDPGKLIPLSISLGKAAPPATLEAAMQLLRALGSERLDWLLTGSSARSAGQSPVQVLVELYLLARGAEGAGHAWVTSESVEGVLKDLMVSTGAFPSTYERDEALDCQIWLKNLDSRHLVAFVQALSLLAKDIILISLAGQRLLPENEDARELPNLFLIVWCLAATGLFRSPSIYSGKMRSQFQALSELLEEEASDAFRGYVIPCILSLVYTYSATRRQAVIEFVDKCGQKVAEQGESGTTRSQPEAQLYSLLARSLDPLRNQAAMGNEIVKDSSVGCSHLAIGDSATLQSYLFPSLAADERAQGKRRKKHTDVGTGPAGHQTPVLCRIPAMHHFQTNQTLSASLSHARFRSVLLADVFLQNQDNDLLLLGQEIVGALDATFSRKEGHEEDREMDEHKIEIWQHLLIQTVLHIKECGVKMRLLDHAARELLVYGSSQTQKRAHYFIVRAFTSLLSSCSCNKEVFSPSLKSLIRAQVLNSLSLPALLSPIVRQEKLVTFSRLVACLPDSEKELLFPSIAEHCHQMDLEGLPRTFISLILSKCLDIVTSQMEEERTVKLFSSPGSFPWLCHFAASSPSPQLLEALVVVLTAVERTGVPSGICVGPDFVAVELYEVCLSAIRQELDEGSIGRPFDKRMQQQLKAILRNMVQGSQFYRARLSSDVLHLLCLRTGSTELFSWLNYCWTCCGSIPSSVKSEELASLLLKCSSLLFQKPAASIEDAGTYHRQQQHLGSLMTLVIATLGFASPYLNVSLLTAVLEDFLEVGGQEKKGGKGKRIIVPRVPEQSFTWSRTQCEVLEQVIQASESLNSNISSSAANPLISQVKVLPIWQAVRMFQQHTAIASRMRAGKDTENGADLAELLSLHEELLSSPAFHSRLEIVLADSGVSKMERKLIRVAAKKFIICSLKHHLRVEACLRAIRLILGLLFGHEGAFDPLGIVPSQAELLMLLSSQPQYLQSLYGVHLPDRNDQELRNARREFLHLLLVLCTGAQKENCQRNVTGSPLPIST